MTPHEQAAYDLGVQHAKNAASWIIDGNTPREFMVSTFYNAPGEGRYQLPIVAVWANIGGRRIMDVFGRYHGNVNVGLRTVDLGKALS